VPGKYVLFDWWVINDDDARDKQDNYSAKQNPCSEACGKIIFASKNYKNLLMFCVIQVYKR
jgi:hypothetical protein